jgi:hypothetical protein
MKLKEFCEVREMKVDGTIEDIYYFEFEEDAEDYMKVCENECLLKTFPVVQQGQSLIEFKQQKLKQQALTKLTPDERVALGL